MNEDAFPSANGVCYIRLPEGKCFFIHFVGFRFLVEPW